MLTALHAVEPPLARVEPGLGRRRHRRLTGPGGVVLFLCAFLPAIKGCDSAVYPIEMPMFLAPYLYGLAFAATAAAVTVRGMRRAISMLRALTIALAGGSVALVFVAPPIGVAELFVGVVLLGILGLRGGNEKRVAQMQTLVGGLATLWFGLWAGSRDAMFGVYLSACASLAVLAGGLVWLVEVL